MKTIKLMKLEIENFKGIRRLQVEPNGQPMCIFGDNATGKTTVYDALTWLLFNKNSNWITDFSVKPLNENGNVRDRGIMPTVKATFDLSGRTMVFSKSLREKWERKRGAPEKTFDGNTADYMVDGVERKENEYQRLISEIVDENVFRELTYVYYFCERLPWQERRKRLFDICKVKSDAEIFASAPTRFDALRDIISNRTVEEHKEVLKAQLRNIKRELDGLPIRIDECDKVILSVGETDFDSLRGQEETRNQQRASLQAELVKLENHTLLAEKQTTLAAVKNDMWELDMENREFRQGKAALVSDQRPAIQQEIQRLEKLLSSAQSRRADRLAEAESLRNAIQKCAGQWHEVDAQEFTDDGICKLCGQKLPPEQIADAREHFERMIEDNLREIEDRADDYKSRLAKAERYVLDQDAEISDYKKSIADARSHLSSLGEPEIPVVDDMPEYHERFALLAEKLSLLENEISELRGETAQARRAIEQQIAALDTELRELRGKIAQEKTIENARNRIAELQNEQCQKAAFQERTEYMIELCEDFIRYKVELITDEINGQFKLVKFKLFANRINGSLQECCEATVNGVPYADINSANKVNAGLDIIEVLSEHAGVKVPLFIDNAESITQLYDIDTQIIRLIVSKQDKTLRCEA